jgi:Carbohydrate-binding family 9
MNRRSYPLYMAALRPEFQGQWEGSAWSKAQVLGIARFCPESSDHRPMTQAKLLYSLEGLFGLFRVQDRYVRSVHRRFQDPVYKDSCVEFFVQPHTDQGYFNFEFNCGGTLLASYIEDPVRTGRGFKVFTRLTKQDSRQVRIYHSLPSRVEPEREDTVTWFLEFFIPFSLIEKYTGPVSTASGTIWRANFFKCADETSHPHWAAWSAVGELNFHQPHRFGAIRFMAPED